MIQVAMAHSPTQHRSLKPKYSDTALEFQGGFVGHCHRQRCQRLKAIGVATSGFRHGIIRAASEVDTVWSQVVQ